MESPCRWVWQRQSLPASAGQSPCSPGPPSKAGHWLPGARQMESHLPPTARLPRRTGPWRRLPARRQDWLCYARSSCLSQCAEVTLTRQPAQANTGSSGVGGSCIQTDQLAAANGASRLSEMRGHLRVGSFSRNEALRVTVSGLSPLCKLGCPCSLALEEVGRWQVRPQNSPENGQY